MWRIRVDQWTTHLSINFSNKYSYRILRKRMCQIILVNYSLIFISPLASSLYVHSTFDMQQQIVSSQLWWQIAGHQNTVIQNPRIKIVREAKDTDSDYREIILRLDKIELVRQQERLSTTQCQILVKQIGTFTNSYTFILGHICDTVCDPVIYALHSTKA